MSIGVCGSVNMMPVGVWESVPIISTGESERSTSLGGYHICWCVWETEYDACWCVREITCTLSLSHTPISIISTLPTTITKVDFIFTNRHDFTRYSLSPIEITCTLSHTPIGVVFTLPHTPTKMIFTERCWTLYSLSPIQIICTLSHTPIGVVFTLPHTAPDLMFTYRYSVPYSPPPTDIICTILCTLSHRNYCVYTDTYLYIYIHTHIYI